MKTQVTITIKAQELSIDIRTKSHQEVASIPDVEARYAAEAGNDKLEEIHRCINEAREDLAMMLRGFEVTPDVGTTTDDLPANWDGATFTYTLLLSPRRQANLLSGPLAAKMHEYIVDRALEKFYRSVSQPILADMHAVKATGAIGSISKYIHYKNPPTV